MTKEKRLHKSLDDVFGFEYIKKSSVKKLKQYFDNSKNEHVIIIEYRVVKSDKEECEKEDNVKRKLNQIKMGKLLQSINADVNKLPLVN